MKIAAPAALSRLASRFQERRARAALGERPPLTAADEDNILSFTRLVTDLTDLLGRENAALQARDPQAVAALYDDKQALLQRLETRQPVVEPFLRESAEVTDQLRLHIRSLSEALELNAGLLQVMAEASVAIRSEVARVRERHSLKGMYDKSGQGVEGLPSRPKGIDTNY